MSSDSDYDDQRLPQAPPHASRPATGGLRPPTLDSWLNEHDDTRLTVRGKGTLVENAWPSLDGVGTFQDARSCMPMALCRVLVLT